MKFSSATFSIARFLQCNDRCECMTKIKDLDFVNGKIDLIDS